MMCGIAGAIWKDGEDRALVAAMTARLRHRGPDDEQLWFAPELGLGFRRLSIIDPAHGRQPVFNEDESVVAVCNGEVYNHVAHREALSLRGHRFPSGSDAEVIPHLYEEHGAGFVDHLRGKFAIALYDRTARRLILARDRLGIKPLYYLDTPLGFWFASELKSLLLAPDYRPLVDRTALDWLLTFKHIPGDATLLAGIRFLPPAQRLVYDLGSHSHAAATYSTIATQPIAPTLDDAAAEVRRRLDDAVRVRLMSDVPLGVSLSGGLDSSAIVASVARQTERPPLTFSVYTGDRVNELAFARLVAERYRTDHREIVIEPEALDRVVPTVLWHIEEPMSISELPTWYLGQAVGRHVKVLLCGEGADEVLGGYQRFQPLAAAGALPRRVLTWGYVRGLNGLTRRDRGRLYAAAQRAFLGPDTNPWLEDALAGPGEVLNRFLRYEVTQQLRSQVKRLDKLTMAHGVEARCPFLDPALVEYGLNLPARLKVRGWREKVVLKTAMVDRLPEAILQRRKLGMSNPVTTLFRGGFADVCRQALRDGRATLEPYFDLAAVDRLFDGIGPRPGRLRLPEMQLFHIYLFLRWHEVFLGDGRGAMPPGEGSVT